MRTRGALAGLVPWLAVAALFVREGTTATPPEVAVSLGLVALITTSAGWLAGPLAAGPRRRLAVAAIGYAIAVLSTNSVLAIMQAAADSIAADGLDVIALVAAVVGRAALGLVGTAYMIVPALLAGVLWSLSAHSLSWIDGPRRRATA